MSRSRATADSWPALYTQSRWHSARYRFRSASRSSSDIFFVFFGFLGFGSSSGTSSPSNALATCAMNASSQSRTRRTASSKSVQSPPIIAPEIALDKANTRLAMVLNFASPSMRMTSSICLSSTVWMSCMAPASLNGCVFWSNPTSRPYWRTMPWKNASYVAISGLWNMPDGVFPAFSPRLAATAAETRDSSSDAALRVKVRPRIFCAGTPCPIRVMMRLVIV